MSKPVNRFWIRLLLIVSCAVPAWVQDDPVDFDALFLEAYQVLDRAERARMMEAALALRPDDPDNLRFEYEIAACYAHNNAGRPELAEQRYQALLMFESIMEKYDYSGYYVPELPDTLGKPQILMLSAALRAATMRMFDHREHDRGREHLVQGMDWVYETYDRRRSDWLNAPEPVWPEDLPKTYANDYDRFQVLHLRWERHLEMARRDAVLSEFEMEEVELIVEHYGKTFGQVRPWEVQGIMRPVIQRYPDSPIAAEAQRQIDRSHEAMRQSGEFDHEGWESMEQAADAMEQHIGSPHREVSERACARPTMTSVEAEHEPVAAQEPVAAVSEEDEADSMPVAAAADAGVSPPSAGGQGWLWGGLLGGAALLGLAVVFSVTRRGATPSPAGSG
ncbi:MAG: hypothetical protein AAGA29_03050 [Planctomycetota bacterium]